MILWLAACITAPEPVAPEPAPEPVQPVVEAAVVTLEAGEKTTCVQRADDTLQCWGALPVAAAGVHGTLEVSDARVCVRDGQQERCWLPGGQVRDRPTPFVEVAGDCGRDLQGALWCRDPRLPDDPEGLISIEAPGAAVSLVVGPQVCALLDTGELGCFAAAEGGRWTRVAEHVDALAGTWLLRCWRIGREVTCRGETKPGRPGRLEDPTLLAVGRSHACVLDAGRVRCWGGSIVVPDDLGPVSALTSGDDHACVLSDGEVRCFGG